MMEQTAGREAVLGSINLLRGVVSNASLLAVHARLGKVEMKVLISVTVRNHCRSKMHTSLMLLSLLNSLEGKTEANPKSHRLDFLSRQRHTKNSSS